MSLTRREFIYAGASSLFALGLAGCGNSSTTSTSTSDAQKEEPKKSEEKQPEKYEVTIGTLTQIADYNGDPAAKITFSFTNNSDETAAFMSSVRVEAYQDGQQLENAVSSDVNWESSMTKIKTGTSLDVEHAYKLISSSDVEVEVYPLFGKDKLADQTFSLQ